jgi:hypothetical protein
VANLAVVQAGTIAKRIFLLAALCRFQVLAGRANITVVFSVEDEIGTAESAVVVLGFIPYRNVWGNPFSSTSHPSIAATP